MADIFTLIAELGFPVAIAFVGGFFIFFVVKYILGGVTGQVKGIHGIIMGLDNRIKTMNNDIIKIDDRSTTNFDPVEHSVENGWFDLAGGDIEEVFCPSDVNRDGNVDFSDMLKVLGDWGCVQGCSGDANGDVLVNFEDVLAVLNHWGGC